MAISQSASSRRSVTLSASVTKGIDELRADAINEWEKHLSKLEIEADCPEQKKTFYTCLYRMFCSSRAFSMSLMRTTT